MNEQWWSEAKWASTHVPPVTAQTHTRLHDPFSRFTKWQWFVSKTTTTKKWIQWLCSLVVAPILLLAGLSHRTRFKDEAHRRYKNIVQQFSCHSKTFIPVHQWPSHISSRSHMKRSNNSLLHRAKKSFSPFTTHHVYLTSRFSQSGRCVWVPSFNSLVKSSEAQMLFCAVKMISAVFCYFSVDHCNRPEGFSSDPLRHFVLKMN